MLSVLFVRKPERKPYKKRSINLAYRDSAKAFYLIGFSCYSLFFFFRLQNIVTPTAAAATATPAITHGSHCPEEDSAPLSASPASDCGADASSGSDAGFR